MLDHALLAGVLGALKDKDVRRGNTVLDEELGLERILGEVFDQHAWFDLHSELVNQCEDLGLIVRVIKASKTHEVAETDASHVGALAQSLTETGLT